VPVWINALEGVVTILLGIAFYLVTIHMVADEVWFRKTLRWVYVAESSLSRLRWSNPRSGLRWGNTPKY
jgi:hypothetical protein